MARPRGTKFTYLTNSLENDEIIDFWDLNVNFQLRIAKYVNSWKINQEKSQLLFYKLDVTGSPMITVSIKITKYLEVQVFIRNNRIEDAYLETFLDSNCLLKYWNQLKKLLKFFGSDAVSTLKHSIDFYIAEAFDNLCSCLDNLAGEDDTKRLRDKVQFLINQVGLLRCNIYSEYTVEVAFSIYLCSSSCYKEIENSGCLSIPTEKELLKLIEKSSVKKG
ncbi:uncharacterized protein CEXT_596601 [Caerostris extrusa]|uniref:Uncharacterized protein n=1 Tax=Caerostris extrusa TaxID=172846 RepID=A0AAV4RS25_CAEEX|nr:uncharacterized protein CEXT_596601 [Caerostris extrusa]